VEWIGHLDQPDIRPRIRDFHLFIFPTLGENFGHAIFEALGSGKPVLISDRTPWHGLEAAKAGFELPLDDPEAWLEKIRFFAGMDEKTYAEWSRGAWRYAKDYFGKQDVKKRYLEMFSV
jgi:glycosyltransferase involved in cell wall biosynthesis